MQKRPEIHAVCTHFLGRKTGPFSYHLVTLRNEFQQILSPLVPLGVLPGWWIPFTLGLTHSILLGTPVLPARILLHGQFIVFEIAAWELWIAEVFLFWSLIRRFITYYLSLVQFSNNISVDHSIRLHNPCKNEIMKNFPELIEFLIFSPFFDWEYPVSPSGQFLPNIFRHA